MSDLHDAIDRLTRRLNDVREELKRIERICSNPQTASEVSHVSFYKGLRTGLLFAIQDVEDLLSEVGHEND